MSGVGVARRCVYTGTVIESNPVQRTLPDIDTLRKMATDNPAELELLRRNLAQQVIDQAAPQNRARLQGLQFEIDAHRQTASNPVAACVKISAMMQASLARLHSTLNVALDSGALDLEPINDTKHPTVRERLTDLQTDTTSAPDTPHNATVLPFKSR